MTFEHKENSGSLFANDKKEKETQPGYRGSAKIGGIEYWISGWLNEKNDKKFFGLKFEKKEEKSEPKDNFDPGF